MRLRKGRSQACQLTSATAIDAPLAMKVKSNRPGSREPATAGTSAGVGKLKSELEPLADDFVEAIFALEAANSGYPEGGAFDEAKYAQATVMPAMDAVRDVADRLERIIPDHLWPLPKYSEILFIK